MIANTEIKGRDQVPQHNRTFYLHYAWVIVSIIAVVQMVGASLRMAFGVMIDPLTQTFGWSQSAVTLAYAISSMATALAAPLAGSLGDHFGARFSMGVGVALFLIGMVMTSLVSQPWQLYLSFGLILGVAQAIFLVPLIPAAMTWFRRHLGLGMGVLMASWGMGPALTAPMMAFLIEQVGWRETFWITGGTAGFIMAAMIVIFRNRPSDKGLLPYGAMPSDPPETAKKPDGQSIRLFAGHMRRTGAYWNMSSIHFLGCVGHSIILVYLVPIAVYEGVSLVAAASLLAVISGMSVLTRMCTPILADSLGPRLVMSVAYFLQGVPVVMLFWSHDLWHFYLFAVAYSIGYGGEAGGFPILNRRYYGHAPMGSAYGMQMMGASMGMAFGGWIGGALFDTMGHYDVALIISMVACLGGAVSILFLEPTTKLLIPRWGK